MVNFDAWLGLENSSANESSHAVVAWSRIQRMNTREIIIKRGSSSLTGQTVRVEYRNNQPRQTGSANENALGYEITLVVFGVKNHPDKDAEENTVPDTDIKANDKFGLDGINYTVQEVIQHLGEVQAMCYYTRK